MKTNYKILRNDDVDELCMEVNMHIQDGWVPLGGVAINPIIQELTFVQAMIRKTEKQFVA